MKIYRFFFVCIIMFIAFCFKSNAQNMNINDITFSTHIKKNSETEMKDTTGNYNSSEIGFGIKIPIYTHIFTNSVGKNGFYNFNLITNNSIIYPNIDFLDKTNTLLKFNLSLSGKYFTGNNNLWLSTISMNLFEDEYSITEPTPKFSGIILYNRKVNKDFSYHFALTYRYSFGQNSLLPLAGLKYSFLNRWKISLSLPFSGSINYKFNEKLLLSAKFKASGNISYYSNRNHLFGQYQDKFLFRKRSTTFSITSLYKLNKNIHFNGEIGKEGNQKIFFSDLKTEINKDPENYFSSAIHSSWFINLRFTYKIGKSQNSLNIDDDIIDYLEAENENW